VIARTSDHGPSPAAEEQPRAVGALIARHRGLIALSKRESHRVLKLWTQTVIAPILSSLLFILVFGLSLGSRIKQVDGVDYEVFIVPGLITMAMVQAAYANNSATVFQARFDRYLNDILASPMRPWEINLGLTLGGVVRALLIALGLLALAIPVTGVPIREPLVLVLAVAIALVLFGSLGVVVGIYAQTWDQAGFVNNLVILPLTAALVKTTALSWDAFWATVTAPRVLASLRLSFGASFFAAAINAVWPQTKVQTCIVHLLRASLRWVNYKDRKRVAAALRTVYAAPTEAAARDALDALEDSELGREYPAIIRRWRESWELVIPFFDFAPDVRRVIYTTNMIESINFQLRKATRNRGHFPSDEALIKVLYLACKEMGRTSTRHTAGRGDIIRNGAMGMNAPTAVATPVTMPSLSGASSAGWMFSSSRTCVSSARTGSCIIAFAVSRARSLANPFAS